MPISDELIKMMTTERKARCNTLKQKTSQETAAVSAAPPKRQGTLVDGAPATAGWLEYSASGRE